MSGFDPAAVSASLLEEARALERAAQMFAARIARTPSDGLTDGLTDIADRASSALRKVRWSMADALVSTELFGRERGRV